MMYVWYIKFIKLFLRSDEQLLFLKGLSVDNIREKNISMSHIHCYALYSLPCDESELMAGATDYLIKNTTRSTTFHLKWPYNSTGSTRTKLKKLYAQYLGAFSYLLMAVKSPRQHLYL